jgi:hypothetical protein
MFTFFMILFLHILPQSFSLNHLLVLKLCSKISYSLSMLISWCDYENSTNFFCSVGKFLKLNFLFIFHEISFLPLHPFLSFRFFTAVRPWHVSWIIRSRKILRRNYNKIEIDSNFSLLFHPLHRYGDFSVDDDDATLIVKFYEWMLSINFRSHGCSRLFMINPLHGDNKINSIRRICGWVGGEWEGWVINIRQF